MPVACKNTVAHASGSAAFAALSGQRERGRPRVDGSLTIVPAPALVRFAAQDREHVVLRLCWVKAKFAVEPNIHKPCPFKECARLCLCI
jgi:hypothetical protein